MKAFNRVKIGLAVASLAAAGTVFAEAPVLTTEVAVGKLELPWDMSFLKDGTMFSLRSAKVCRFECRTAPSTSCMLSAASVATHLPAQICSVMAKRA